VTDGPELSVVICTLESGALAKTADSIASSARRAGREAEVIVAWSGSGAAPSVDGVRVLEVFPAGLSYARNRAVAAARAPLVSFVDEDELVDLDWVRALFEAFEQGAEVAGVFGPINPSDDVGLPYCYYQGDERQAFRGTHTAPWLVGSGGNMTFRRSLLLAVGGFDQQFGVGSVGLSAEETDLIVRLLRAGHTLLWSPEAAVSHPTKSEAERLASRYPYGFGMGRLARHHRDALMVARYGRNIGQVFVRAAREKDRRRLRETGQTLRGFAAGLVSRAKPSSPERALAWLPEVVAAELNGAAIEPRPAVDFGAHPHFLYRVCADRLLHVYVNPAPGLGEGLDAPAVVLGKAGDSLWVLERAH
jgi:glycosyl transferase family 2